MRGEEMAAGPGRGAAAGEESAQNSALLISRKFEVGSRFGRRRRRWVPLWSIPGRAALRRMAALLAEPSVDVWRKRWVRAVDMYLFRADKKRISRSAQQMVLTESMLLCNRMGFSLREEAVLGIYARAWNRGMETSGADPAGRP